MVEQTHYPDEQTETTGKSALEQFSEDFAGTVVAPSRTLRQIGERQAIVPAIFLILLIVAVSAAGQIVLILFDVGTMGTFDTQLPGVASGSFVAVQVVGVLWNFIWAPVFWTIAAGMLYGIAYLLGGRGQFASLWAATGFALVPQLLVAPVSTAGEFLGLLGSGWQLLGSLAVLPVTIGAAIWTLVLFTISVRETMGLTTGRSVGTVAILIGGVIMLAILFLCVIFLIIAAVIGVSAS